MAGTTHGTMAGAGTISIDTITHGDGIVRCSGDGITAHHGITDHTPTPITGDTDMQDTYLTTGSNLEDTILAETAMVTPEGI